MTNQQIIDNLNARIESYRAKFNLDENLQEILLDSYCESIEQEVLKELDMIGGKK